MSDRDGERQDSRRTSLGYLLKHAHLAMDAVTSTALAPMGIDGRELGVLVVIADHAPASQQQIAERLGVDRTTMVALLDTLEHKGLIARQPHAGDRRRNVVLLTVTGQRALRRGVRLRDAAEQRFLSPLTAAAARELRRALAQLTTPDES